MEPLAKALGILQSDTWMYMGYLLSVLTSLQQKLEKLSKQELTYCQPLITAIREGLKEM